MKAKTELINFVVGNFITAPSLISRFNLLVDDFEKECRKSFDSSEFDDELLTIEHLKKCHPNLNDDALESLLQFSKNNTINHIGCYGHGQIQYPKWLAQYEGCVVKKDN